MYHGVAHINTLYKPCYAWLIFLGLYLCACNAPTPKAGNATVPNKVVPTPPLPTLHTGDIICRMGTGPYSLMLAQMNARDKKYSHCGIVVLQHDTPYVYHCIGGEDRPNLRMQREPVSSFCRRQYCLALAVVHYALQPGQIQAIADTTLAIYARQPLFDLQFSLESKDKFYCSELVYTIYNTALHDTAFIPTSSYNGRTYVGIDDLYSNIHHPSVWQVDYK